MTFDQAFERLIDHEKGYVSAEQARRNNDPGGETNFGISKRSYPGEDIRNMTLARAKDLYRRDYWWAAGCDTVPDAVKFDLFDMAVNSGVKPAIRTMQKAVGVPDDGVIGPVTLQAIGSMHPARFVARFNGARLAFMTDLQNWPENSKGWARRVAKNLMEA